MHPIVSEQIARSRSDDLQREATARRRAALARRGRPAGGWRVAGAVAALRLARALDRDGRVVPSPAAR